MLIRGTIQNMKMWQKVQDHSFTVWKYQDFAITQILCEINFGDYGSAKTAVFTILGDVNLVHLVNTSFLKSATIHKNQNSGPVNVVK